eukprot:COSAG02_NODE_40545_length_404_cov_0.849180_1_plen_26_part_01
MLIWWFSHATSPYIVPAYRGYSISCS